MSKKIAIQGILGSFHDMAAHKHFGDDIELYECDTFRSLCVALDKGEVDFAMMAIENSIAGSLLANYSLLKEFHFRVIGEVFLHIQMHLMALPNTKIEDLEFVHSHPIAIRQCAEYLETLKHVKVLEKNDTADSAKEIQNKQLKNTAAVAGIAAAQIYGLEILEKRIETHKKNYTRFLVLSKHGIVDSQNNKASICFELSHQVGALANVLNILTKHNINLTKIQSVPILGKPYEYIFYVDLEWKQTEEYEKAIRELLNSVASISILGEYKHSEWAKEQTLDKWVNV